MTSYTPEEVFLMTDECLLKEASKIWCIDAICCLHCAREKPLENFIYSIRKRCYKPAGLSKAVKVPKTCDKAMKTNEKMNPIVNPITNALSKEKTKLKKAGMSDEVISATLVLLKATFKKI